MTRVSGVPRPIHTRTRLKPVGILPHELVGGDVGGMWLCGDGAWSETLALSKSGLSRM